MRKIKKKFTIGFVKSKIPKGFLDAKGLNGIPLRDKWYTLSCMTPGKEIQLLTGIGDPVIDVLQKHFKVEYLNHMWGPAYRYIIKPK